MPSRLLLALLALLATPAAAAGQTLADAGLDDLPVRGTDATATAFVPVAPGFAVAGGTVDLRFDHSPLLRADRSTVTLEAGGRALASARLTPRNAEGGRLRARLPALPGATGGLLLTARFSMRLTRDRCEDPRNAALWATVLDTTRVEPRLVPADRTLGQALEALGPPQDGAVLPFLLPEAPDADALAAAGAVAAGLGRTAAVQRTEPLVALARDGAEQGRVVRVGTGAGPAGLAPGEGALALSADGPPRLSVDGGDGDGLRRAARALAARRLTPLGTRTAVLRTDPVPAPRAAVPWREGAASFAQLGIEPREVAGAGTQVVELELDRPPQWRVREAGTLELVLDVGAGLRGDGSSVSVRLAGRELGTRRLEPAAGLQRVRFEVPPGLLDTDLAGRAVRTAPLTLRFDLQPQQRDCVPLDVSATRVVVLDTSSIELPHEDSGQLDLSRVPAPMGARGRPARVVLPASPSDAEVAAGLQAVAAIARWQDPAGELPSLTTADRLGTARDRDDLVLVGDADEDLGRAIEVPGGADPGPRAGAVVLDDSPWAEGRAVLALQGEGDALLTAARAIARPAAVRRLAGRAVVVRAGAAPQALAPADPPLAPPVALAPVVEEGPFGDLPVWTVPAVVVLVVLLLTGVLLGRRRWLSGRRG